MSYVYLLTGFDIILILKTWFYFLTECWFYQLFFPGTSLWSTKVTTPGIFWKWEQGFRNEVKLLVLNHYFNFNMLNFLCHTQKFWKEEKRKKEKLKEKKFNIPMLLKRPQHRCHSWQCWWGRRQHGVHPWLVRCRPHIQPHPCTGTDLQSLELACSQATMTHQLSRSKLFYVKDLPIHQRKHLSWSLQTRNKFSIRFKEISKTKLNWFQANLLSFGQVSGDLSCTTSQSWISFVSQHSKNELKKEKKN